MQANEVRFDFSNMMADILGKNGFTQSELDNAGQDIEILHKQMSAKKAQMAWRDLPFAKEQDLQQIMLAGEQIRNNFESFVVLGIGGSALGARALFRACCHPRHNELPAGRRNAPRFYVLDNIDAESISALFDVIELKRTAFYVVSKSGSTVETMSQFVLVADLLHKELGADFHRNLFFCTDAKNGQLRDIINYAGWRQAFELPEAVGGRFSVLSAVGLLPAAVLGIDITELLSGAAEMDKRCSMPQLDQNPAYMYALLHTLAYQRGCNISVIMPYADALVPFAVWYCQLWAESLGKARDNNGRQINWGQTPVSAVGVTDQHSQLQLYCEGPDDKIITFIRVEKQRAELKIPAAPLEISGAAYLYGQSFNHLFDSEQKAMEYAVSQCGKLNNCLTIGELNACTLGKLFFFFEMATAAAGELLQLNAFDQPGVEAGKNATYALMQRPGYEHQAEELHCAFARAHDFVYHC